MANNSELRTIRGYELQEQIGKGGYGVVYRAYQPSVGRQVAVKMILPHYLDQAEFISRFESEAKLVARLEHPYIVPLYDYWRDDDGAYLVMRWLRGGSLGQSLQKNPWDLEAAAQLLDQITSALTTAHEQGVIHRDVKPQNIMLDEVGNAYLADFGIAKDLFHTTYETASGVVPGSLFYIAPEQAQGEPVTPLCDLYSLGIVMYEVLTGEHPFAGEAPAAQIIKVLTEPVPLLRERWPSFPEALDVVIQRVTAKEPNQRYPDALAFAAAFREAISDTVADFGAPLPKIEIRSKQPAFLSEDAENIEMESAVFVSRERELDWLNTYLDLALDGKGQIVFVTGGPGRGKTALLREFSMRSMKENQNLLVANGNCNAYSGVGDSYLPFREVMGMLTGDIESLWEAGAVTTGQARRSWASLPLAVRSILDHGPHLAGVFVNDKKLISRAASASSADASWVEELRKDLERQRTRTDSLEQSHIFEQYTNVLRAIANQRPLILILDDMQWADKASIGLLFHLGRRLEGAKILVVCAYRPEEVAIGQVSQVPHSVYVDRHPLEKVLSEFKRQFGDVWLDLGEIEQVEGRGFVDAFLDSEPNRLGEGFRQALFNHTGGHPLFTIELLRAMQEKGSLVLDDNIWVEGRSLDWEMLPAKVEGVIEERIGRLEDDLSEILSVASVEGVNFTAQVVARVQDISERKLLQKLSRELEKRHRLVKEKDGVSVGQTWLARYRFAHALFQQHLYNNVSQGERRLLHRTIGEILEELYGDRAETIAVQLVHHFAGDQARERIYAKLAGEQAASRFDHAEALSFFSKALILTPEDDLLARYQLFLAREAVYNMLGERDAQRDDLEELKRLVTLLKGVGDEPGEAEVTTRWVTFTSHTDYQGAAPQAEKAVTLAQSEGKLEVAVEAYIIWSHVLRIQGEHEDAVRQAEAGISLARDIGDAYGESRLLNIVGLTALDQRDPTGARDYFTQSAAIAQDIGDLQGEAQPLNNLGNLAGSEGDYQAAQGYYEQALKIAREIGNRRGEGLVLGNLGWIASVQGDYSTADKSYLQNQGIAREISDRYQEAYAAINLCTSKLAQGDFASANDFAEQGLEISRETGDRSGEAWSLTFLGHVRFELNDLALAEKAYQDSLGIRWELTQSNLAMEPLAGLARVSLKQNKLPAAQEFIEEILSHLDGGGSLDGAEEPLRVWLTCYQVLKAVDDPRADSILETTYHQLQARANELSDESLRRSFLENIPHHVELLTAWKGRKGG